MSSIMLPSRITREMLVSCISEYPAEITSRQPAINFVTALRVVTHYMGNEWVERHAGPFSSKPGYYQLNVNDNGEERIAIIGQKIVILGEHLFNLQHVEGFDSCIRRLRDGQLEPTVAELQIAAMFYINDWAFRFVEPIGEIRRDYDYEITLDNGIVACADTKCKIESTTLSKNTILNALRKALRQLPDNKPGYVLIKFPADWLKIDGHIRIMVEATQCFFRSSARVVSVAFYTDPISIDNTGLTVKHQFMEVPNKQNKFDTTRDWRLFERWRPTAGSANGMPPKWRTFINFPNDF